MNLLNDSGGSSTLADALANGYSPEDPVRCLGPRDWQQQMWPRGGASSARARTRPFAPPARAARAPALCARTPRPRSVDAGAWCKVGSGGKGKSDDSRKRRRSSEEQMLGGIGVGSGSPSSIPSSGLSPPTGLLGVLETDVSPSMPEGHFAASSGVSSGSRSPGASLDSTLNTSPSAFMDVRLGDVLAPELAAGAVKRGRGPETFGLQIGNFQPILHASPAGDDCHARGAARAWAPSGTDSHLQVRPSPNPSLSSLLPPSAPSPHAPPPPPPPGACIPP